MRIKTVISALVFSIGMSCQIGSAFAAPTGELVGALTAINQACQFNNLGSTVDNLCGGAGWVGIQCNLPRGVVPVDSVITLNSGVCVIDSAKFVLDSSAATITYCIPSVQVLACVSANDQVNFVVSQSLGGQVNSLGDLTVQTPT